MKPSHTTDDLKAIAMGFLVAQVIVVFGAFGLFVWMLVNGAQ